MSSTSALSAGCNRLIAVHFIRYWARLIHELPVGVSIASDFLHLVICLDWISAIRRFSTYRQRNHKTHNLLGSLVDAMIASFQAGNSFCAGLMRRWDLAGLVAVQRRI